MTREVGDRYPNNSLLDLREQVENLVPHFQWYALRQVDYTKPCSCRTTESSNSVSSPVPCDRCFRYGYLFTDYLVKGYMWSSSMGFEFKTEVGTISTQKNNFVLKHNRTINKFDNVMILNTDPDTGKVRQPFSILRLFQVQDSMPLFGKDGRIEFYKAFIEERNIDDFRDGSLGTEFSYEGNRSNTHPR